MQKKPKIQNLKAIVVLSDSLLSLVNKGELKKRYYNPAEVFDEIILIHPPPFYCGKNTGGIFGKAKVTVWRSFLPKGFYFGAQISKTMCRLLMPHSSLQKIKTSKPDLIRAYGHGFGLHFGKYLADQLKIPLVASLHSDPEKEGNQGRLGKKNIFRRVVGKIQAITIKDVWKSAEFVIGVYDSLRPYLSKVARNKYCILPHAVEQGTRKTNYTLSKKPTILYVGRLSALEKNPINIICALQAVPKVKLDIYGQGDLKNKILEMIKQNNLQKRVRMYPSCPNQKLVCKMKKYDWMASNCQLTGISKVWIEASFVGLPLVINRQRRGNNRDFWCLPALHVQDSARSYARAFRKLLTSKKMRQNLGCNAKKHAQRFYASDKLEKCQKTILHDVLGRKDPLSRLDSR